MLTAFYFRQSGYGKSGDHTFEFTHKSFGEFLTARRIVRELIKINKKLREEELDDRWDEKEALVHWAKVCGQSTIDQYLLVFIRNEIARQKTDRVKEWQETLSRLISYMLDKGMPMERIESCLTYKESVRQARNAEEALLVALSSCARQTKESSKIQWQSQDHSFRQWLLRLQNCIDYRAIVAVQCLNYLDLSSADLSSANLRNADLSYADLSSANLRNADLSEAKNFTPAQIKSALNWEEAIYKAHWDEEQGTWIVDREANQQYIEELKSQP